MHPSSIGSGGSPSLLLASVLWGTTETTSLKQLLPAGADALNILVATLSIGAASLSPVLLAGAGQLGSPADALLVAWLGLVATAAAYLLFVRGLDRVPASTAGTLSFAEPLTAA